MPKEIMQNISSKKAIKKIVVGKLAKPTKLSKIRLVRLSFLVERSGRKAIFEGYFQIFLILQMENL